MTEPTEMEASTSPHSPEVNGGPSKRGRGFVNTLLRPRGINLLTMMVGTVVLAVCGVLLYEGYKGVRDAQAAAVASKVEDSRIEGIRHDYESDVRLHDKKVSDYNTCVASARTRVQTRSDIRDILFDYANGLGDAIAQVFPGVPEGADLAEVFAKARIANVNARLPALTEESQVAMCVSPGPDPVVPPELR